MKFKKVHSGRYISQDGRFTITRKRFTDTWWLVEDNRKTISRDGTRECATLADAKQEIDDHLSDEGDHDVPRLQE